ncbi:MAG: lamin tail domain-containing protein [Prevotellaceae bacterium]|jgi:hypothetical protein|nr:lamin tail domain-containing protein [Prevotellaceae bacterium]
MKKIYLSVATIAFIFVSCVKNEPFKEPEESELRGNLFLNEVNGTGGLSQVDTEKYVELYNKTNADINLQDFSLDYGGTETWRGRAQDVVPAHGFKLIKGTKTTYPGMSTGLSSRNANVNLTLLDPDGNVVDYYEKIEDLNGKPFEQMDHMRIPDGGKWYFVEITAQSPGASNLSDPNHPAVKGAMPAMEKGLKIEELSVSPAKPSPGDDVTFVAKVTDINVITSVVLKWKLNGVDQPEKVMTKEGNNYTAIITKQANGAVVEWIVLATNDKAKTASESGTLKWEMLTADYTKIRFNEVSGVGDDADKFYELINTGTADISLAGCQIFYNANGANGGALPTGDGNLTWTGSESQVIGAGKLFCLVGRNTTGSFTTGLTAARILIITLKDPVGNVIDQCIRAEDTGKYAFTDKSFSRIPDGTGPFYFTTPSPDVMNGSDATGLVLVPITQVPYVDYSKLKLNEVNGVAKWFEIYNTGDVAISLEGVTAHYSNSEPASYNATNTWTGTSTQTIPAKGYFSTEGITLGTGLSANNANVRLQLRDPEGAVLDTYEKLIDINTGKGYDHLTNKSHARIPDGTGTWYYTEDGVGTSGTTNGTNTDGCVKFGDEDGSGPTPDYTNLILNEVSGNNKYVEIYNSGSEDISLAGVKLQRNNGPTAGGSEWTGTASDVIPAGAYRLFLFNSFTPADLNTNPAYTGWTVSSGISSGQILKVAIVDPAGNPISVFIRGDVPLPAWQFTTDVTQNSTESYSRMDDGTWAYATPTPGTKNGEKTSEIVNPGYLTAQP